MENESDESLFTYLQFFETDPAEGNAALAELMKRYEATLRRRCNWLCRKYPSLGLAGEDLTGQTFWKAIQGASTYKSIAKIDATQRDQFQYTGAWLFRIAQNLLYDLGRDAERERAYERDITEPQSLSPVDVAALLVEGELDELDPADRPLVARAFDSLTERAQTVVVWTVDKRQHSPTGATYMNRNSVTELANRLDTTTANIRQIRKRAFDEIKRAVKEVKKNSRGKR